MVVLIGSGQMDNFKIDVTLSCKCRTRCTGKKSCPCKSLGNSCCKLCHPSWSCTNKICPSSSQSICVDEYCSSSVQQLVWCKGLNLTVEDKSVILNGQWLNDNIISAFQHLLKVQFPMIGSLQDTILGRSFQFEPCRHEVVQVVHVGDNHLVLFTTVGCLDGEVHWLDSLHLNPSSRAQKLITDVMQYSK